VFNKFKKFSLILEIVIGLVALVVIGVSVYIVISLKKDGF